MKNFIFISISVLFCLIISSHAKSASNYQLVINEFCTHTSGADWAEIKLISSEHISLDISKLSVTMYYGTNENLSDDPILLYSYDKPETPYDDRFAVIHFTSDMEDETSYTGDINSNDCIDIYCNNYSSSLWNNEGCVAIDSDDNPENGMVDFVFYSDMDGSAGASVSSYTENAALYANWVVPDHDNIQSSAVSTNEVPDTFYIARKNEQDNNCANDFSITLKPTPGRENIFLSFHSTKGKLFTTLSKKYFIKCDNKAVLKLKFFHSSEISAQLFSAAGIPVSKFINEIAGTGINRIVFPLKQKCIPGMYIAWIRASNSSLSQTEKIIVIVTK